jgi:hypothetical protein
MPPGLCPCPFWLPGRSPLRAWLAPRPGRSSLHRLESANKSRPAVRLSDDGRYPGVAGGLYYFFIRSSVSPPTSSDYSPMVLAGWRVSGRRRLASMATLHADDIVSAVRSNDRQRGIMSDQIEERREETRHAIHFPGSLIPALIGHAAHSAVVRNISLGGIGLVVNQDSIAEDGRVIVQLYNSARSCWHLKLAVVAYALPRDDESRTVGCSFLEPLAQGDYRGLLAAATQDAS